MPNNDYIVGFRSPALPYPPAEYDPFQFEEFNKVLRPYFNQLDNVLRDTSMSRQTEAMGWFLG